jgi:hypothetical protein
MKHFRSGSDETWGIVSSLESGAIELRARGIDQAMAAELRGRLTTFAEDWDSPEMNVYDDYDVTIERMSSSARNQ